VGITALKEYHREWKASLNAYAALPEHDWASHHSDAFRYLCQAIKYNIKSNYISSEVSRPVTSVKSKFRQAKGY
jgi:hypothetical protein